MVTLTDFDTARGILSQHFLFYLNEGDASQLTPQIVAEMRRSFYAGAASVLDTVDELSPEQASHALIIMKAEIHALADELNAANDRDPDPAGAA